MKPITCLPRKKRTWGEREGAGGEWAMRKTCI